MRYFRADAGLVEGRCMLDVLKWKMKWCYRLILLMVCFPDY